MCCIICYNNSILNLNPKTQARRFIIYNTINDITALRKHVNVDHSIFFLIWRINEQSFEGRWKTNCKKKTKYVFQFHIQFLLLKNNISKKMIHNQNNFWRIFGFLIIKNHLCLQVVESIWLKQFSIHLCPRLFSPSRT